MRTKICFIDDAQHELGLFQQAFGETFDIISGLDLHSCLAAMAAKDDWHPDLFVLDLYFPYAESDESAIRDLREKPLDLQPDQGEMEQAYKNYIAAKKRMKMVLTAHSQSPDGGLALAEDVLARFPSIPVVFYSRKALAEDVLRCIQLEGVEDVIQKPTGSDPEPTTLQATMQEAPRIASLFQKHAAGAGPATSAESKSILPMRKVVEAADFLMKVIDFFRNL